MAALPQKNMATVSLTLLADDKNFLSRVTELLTDPMVSVASYHLSADALPILPIKNSDVVVACAPKFEFSDFLQKIQFLHRQIETLNLLVIDPYATPQRAVDAMKAKANDYLEIKTDNLPAIVARVEELCVDTLFQIPDFSAGSQIRGAGRGLKVLHNKIRKVVQAATFLTTCKSLQEICEGLLDTLGEALGASGGSLYLKHDDHMQRVHSLDPGHAPEMILLPLEKDSIFDQVASSGEPLLITGQDAISERKLSGWEGYRGDSVLVYPLRERDGSLIGIFSLHGKVEEGFTKEDRDLVLILAAYSHETIRALFAQEKSKKALESLQLTFENMNEGIILLDSLGRVVQYNQNVSALIGIDTLCFQNSISISDIYDLLYERGDLSDLPENICPWLGLKSDFEYVHFCFDGSIVKFVGNSLEAGGYVLTLTDITRQKNWETELFQAKEKAEAASASKTNFLANVSHELRTPLNAIIGFSEMITKEVFGPLQNERYSEYVTHIHESGSHLLRLINNLLDLSKVEAGKFQLHMSEVETASLIQSTGYYFARQAEDAGVELIYSDCENIGKIWADENALRQIFLNLISNAIKFTPKGGEVKVIAEIVNNQQIRFTVQDTGIGMAKKSIETALQPFGQIENAFNRKYPGTGLGLPLVASLAELHGGRLEVDSELGQGTSCAVLLPIEASLQN
jgi:signal transduction histidine kinase/ActR/RegA family two-component response regulator